MWPRILPFVLYMGFIVLESILQSASTWLPPLAARGALLPLWLYPVKTVVVLGAIVVCWRYYDELHERLWVSAAEAALAIGAGVLVYLAWVRMDWPWATMGTVSGYNPWQAGTAFGGVLAAIRLFGASIVVPVMEELFWRSFLVRFVITLYPEKVPGVTAEFTSVRLGTFTWISFIATVLLFGSEHALWLAGIMAGVVYNLLLYTTRRLWPCVIAHGVTNLLLGIHVLWTQEWQWW